MISLFQAVSRCCLTLFALAIVSATCRVAKAELTWEQKTVEVHGDASTPVLDAHFRFTNSGSSPVEIRSVESSCGCTTAALEKRIYNPREKGEIQAKYTVGTHTGVQRKTLLVVTNDGSEPTTLTLVAHVPEILRVTPVAAMWAHSAATSPKHLSLELMQSTPFDEISAESSSQDVTAELVPIIKGRKYDLIVTPKHTDHFVYSKLTIRCRFGDQEKTFVAYATVQPGSKGSSNAYGANH